MDNFIFNLPTKIVFGKGEFEKLGNEAKSLGKKALVVTGKRFAKESGLLKKAEGLLKQNGLKFVEFIEIEPNPESNTIDKGGELARKKKVDFIIALGGGSVIDAAKAISAIAVTGKPIWDYYERPPREKLPEKMLPIIAVVTVSATGSEADSASVVVNSKTRDKRGMFSPSFFPKIAIVDPLLTLSIPKKQTVDGVVDMFTHILESYLSSKAIAPVSDRISEGLMKVIIKKGEVVFNDLTNIEAREALSWISTLALSGIPNAGRRGPHPIHRLEHPISGIYGIAHGRGLAALMPAFLYHTKEIHSERLKVLGQTIFSTDSPTKTIERIVHWLKNLEAFNSLKEFGIKKESLERFAEMAIADDGGKGFVFSREPLNKETILKIYETAYNYKDLFRKA
jgi:alcohol dehydrogenase YqhD (iron-dependent ADH family)